MIDHNGFCTKCQLISYECTCPADPQGEGGDISGHVLDDLHSALVEYCVLSSKEEVDAVVLWIAATHAQSAWEHATRLVITAPEKRCGKSRLLDIVEATCHKPLISVNISPAALVRSIGTEPPTILVDESDTIFGKKAADNHEDLRGLINAGHQRNRPYIRWDVATKTTEKCETFAMCALAGIGDLPDTIMDRAIVIRMRRRAPKEVVKPYRIRRDRPALHRIRDDLFTWILNHIDELVNVTPEMPVDDRSADNWEPLIAVADLAGGDWPERARNACETLAGTSQEKVSIGIRLLKDLRDIFGDKTSMHTVRILEKLNGLEESPWSNWYGREFAARDLAEMVGRYEIESMNVNVNGTVRKGYRRDHFHDVWERYGG